MKLNASYYDNYMRLQVINDMKLKSLEWFVILSTISTICW